MKPKIDLRDPDLLFFDFETTGTTPTFHEIIEIGALRVRQDDLSVVEELDLRMQPAFHDRLDQEAISVNRYDFSTWAKSPNVVTHFEGLARFLSLANGTIPVAHNLKFDWSFLVCAADEMGLAPLVETSFANHRGIDTVSLLWPYVLRRELESPSLEGACTHFGIPIEGQHQALSDARRCFAVYKRLLEDVYV